MHYFLFPEHPDSPNPTRSRSDLDPVNFKSTTLQPQYMATYQPTCIKVLTPIGKLAIYKMQSKNSPRLFSGKRDLIISGNMDL
uniref:Uncharacterized protein n=1 Tax=Romanomermis culicivorax TaxID=13658 RepID=A0A915KNQ9_ROMCU